MIKVRDFNLGVKMGKIICNECNKSYSTVKEVAEIHGLSYWNVTYLCDDCYKEYDKKHQVKAHL